MLRVFLCVFISFIFLNQLISCTHLNNACNLPQSLQHEVAHRYPGYDIVTADLLDSYDRSLFIEEFGEACPGKVKINFFGNDKLTFALLLINRSLTPHKVELIIAKEDKKDWDFVFIEETDVSLVPVIWSEPAGEYEDYLQENKIVSKYPVLLLVRYEAWAILYYWTGTEVKKIWLTD